jgi:hypothetical protein
MHFYHQGVAIQPSVARSGNTYVARVSILEEDGDATSLGDLGHFANQQSAFAFAVRCGTAFVDDEAMPLPPCSIRSARISAVNHDTGALPSDGGLVPCLHTLTEDANP